MSDPNIHPYTGKPKAVKVINKASTVVPDSSSIPPPIPSDYYDRVIITFEGSPSTGDIDDVKLLFPPLQEVALTYYSTTPNGSFDTDVQYDVGGSGSSVLAIVAGVGTVNVLVGGTPNENTFIDFSLPPLEPTS